MRTLYCFSVGRNGIFYSLQREFGDHRSCETQLLEFVYNVGTNMENGLQIQTDVAILDFSKAFDKVSHQQLVEKLKWYMASMEVQYKQVDC